MGKFKMKKILSLCLAFAIAFTTIAIALPTKASAGTVTDASQLKDKYDVKLTYSYTGLGGDIDHDVKVAILGNADNAKGNSIDMIYNETKDFYEKSPSPIFGSHWYDAAIIVGYETVTGTHYDGQTALFPTEVTGEVKSTFSSSGLNSETISYVLTINGNEFSFDIRYDEFKKVYSYIVPEEAYPYIDSAFISVDKNEVTVGDNDQYVTATAIFGDQYDVKWTANANETYSIVDGNGNPLTIPGVTVDGTGKVTITNAAANANNQQFCVKVTANGKSAVSTPITIKTPVYKVTFKYNNDVLGEVPYIYGATALDTAKIPALPTETGCTFAWESYTLNNTNFDVNAVRNANVYTATFKADGVAVGEAQQFTVDNKDTAVVAPAVPEKAGYTGAWEPYALGASDIEINAVYTPIVYTVTFVNGDSTTTTANYTVEDKTVTEPVLVQKDGYTAYWEAYDLNTLGNKTVNATYTANEYTATFIADGDIVAKVPFTVETIDNVAAPTVPEKEGYTGAWEEYTLGAADVEIVANYEINSYKVIFVDGYTDAILDEQDVDYNNAATAPANPTRAGYEFTGWDVAFDNITADTTVTAQWKLAPVVIIDDETPLAGLPTDGNNGNATDKANGNGSTANVSGNADKTGANNNASNGTVTLVDETPLAAANTADNTNLIGWSVVATAAVCGSLVIVKKKSEEE